MDLCHLETPQAPLEENPGRQVSPGPTQALTWR